MTNSTQTESERKHEQVLGHELARDPEFHKHFLCKGSAFRGVVAALEQNDLLDQVCAEVPAEVAAHLRQPPASTEWMQAIEFQYVFRGVEICGGMDGLKRVGRDGIFRGPLKTMRPFIEGTLRLFGGSPTAFFRRIPSVMESQIKGLRFSYEERGPTEVAITVHYDWLKDVPLCAFVYWEAVFGVTFELCGVAGRGSTHVLPSAFHDTAEIRLSWG